MRDTADTAHIASGNQFAEFPQNLKTECAYAQYRVANLPRIQA